MIDIINESILPIKSKITTKRSSCMKCGCMFDFSEDEIKTDFTEENIYLINNGFRQFVTRYVTCPCCGDKVTCWIDKKMY